MNEQDCNSIIYSANAAADNSRLHKLDPSTDHPAIFPEVLPVIPILSCSRPNDIVLDPFGGSGTTAAVALMLGRKAIMYETEERFVKLAHKRIESLLPDIDKSEIVQFEKSFSPDNDESQNINNSEPTSA